jgi:hypothetical protein
VVQASVEAGVVTAHDVDVLDHGEGLSLLREAGHELGRERWVEVGLEQLEGAALSRRREDLVDLGGTAQAEEAEEAEVSKVDHARGRRHGSSSLDEVGRECFKYPPVRGRSGQTMGRTSTVLLVSAQVLGKAAPMPGVTPPVQGKAAPPLGKAPHPLGKAAPLLGVMPPVLGKTAHDMGGLPPVLGRAPHALSKTAHDMGGLPPVLDRAPHDLGEAAQVMGMTAPVRGKAAHGLGEAPHVLPLSSPVREAPVARKTPSAAPEAACRTRCDRHDLLVVEGATDTICLSHKVRPT